MPQMSYVEHSISVEYLGSDRSVELFMYAVSHAQSCMVLYRRIFEYIHSVHPEYRVPTELETFQEILAERNRPLVYAYLPPKEYGDPWVEGGLDYQAYIMWQELNKRPPWPERAREEIVSDLVDAIIWEDFHYLRDRRHVKQPALALDFTIREPIPSYLCYFGFEKNTTGSAELDQMYEDVSRAILSARDSAGYIHGLHPSLNQHLRRVTELHYAEMPSHYGKNPLLV